MLKKMLIIAILSVALLISSCNNATDSQNPTPTSLSPSETPILPTETPQPTPTSEPAVAVLVAPMELDPDWVSSAQNTLASLAGQAEMILDVRTSLQPSEIAANWKIVVFLSTPGELQSMTAANPNCQFIVFLNGQEEAPASIPNLNTIRVRSQDQAFIAGYLTTLIAYDYRAGALLPSDFPDSDLMTEAFLNGGSYFCGRCTPIYSPMVVFPVISALPAATPMDQWFAAYEELMSNFMYVIYVSPEAASPDLLSKLVDNNMILVGAQTPPEIARSRWAATVQINKLAPLEQAWQSIRAGESGLSINAPIQLTDIQPEFLTPGRQQLVENTIQLLADGWIEPISPPYP